MKTKLAFILLIALSAGFGFVSCTIPTQPGRFTYVVKYSVSYTEPAVPTTAMNPTITRKDSTGINPATLPVTSSWSEEFTFSYTTDGYDNQFVPEMAVVEDLDEAGDSITVTISWKDYKTDFQEEVLASYSATFSSSTINVNETLYGTTLPK